MSTPEEAVGRSTRPGFSTLTPYLMVVDVEATVRFLQAAFGARETFRGTGGGGGTHVEMRLGDSMLMVGGDLPPDRVQPGSFFLYVQDVDAVYAQALEAGATSLMEPGALFTEARGAGVRDPFGNSWYLGFHEAGE